ncbi:hypothetical protein EDB89DRAFT_1925030 [Lactarius sanguifluus]|nr:hypothetical protein EDB89DRAFT_1925030 [Lactarius sanguifluus]
MIALLASDVQLDPSHRLIYHVSSPSARKFALTPSRWIAGRGFDTINHSSFIGLPGRKSACTFSTGRRSRSFLRVPRQRFAHNTKCGPSWVLLYEYPKMSACQDSLLVLVVLHWVMRISHKLPSHSITGSWPAPVDRVRYIGKLYLSHLVKYYILLIIDFGAALLIGWPQVWKNYSCTLNISISCQGYAPQNLHGICFHGAAPSQSQRRNFVSISGPTAAHRIHIRQLISHSGKNIFSTRATGLTQRQLELLTTIITPALLPVERVSWRVCNGGVGVRRVPVIVSPSGIVPRAERCAMKLLEKRIYNAYRLGIAQRNLSIVQK